MPLKYGRIEQTVFIQASPQEVYDAFLDPKKHSAFTGSPATTNAKVGSEFQAWDGYISGKNLELVKGKKIVQEWETHRVAGGLPPVAARAHPHAQEGRHRAKDGALAGPRGTGRRVHLWMARVLLGAYQGVLRKCRKTSTSKDQIEAGFCSKCFQLLGVFLGRRLNQLRPRGVIGFV